MIVVDNIIEKDYQNYIFELIQQEDFPLYYRKNIVDPRQIFDGQDNVNGFTHQLYEDQRQISHYFSALYPLVLNITGKTGLKFNALDRMRFNFVQGNSHSILDYHLPHVDNMLPHLVAIYYVHDCDGDTFIFDQRNESRTYNEDEMIAARNQWTIAKRVTPKKGRMVVFDGRHYHASSFTKTHPYRCVINMNLSI